MPCCANFLIALNCFFRFHVFGTLSMAPPPKHTETEVHLTMLHTHFTSTSLTQADPILR